MSWIKVLSDTYDYCLSEVGKAGSSRSGKDVNVLLPLAHSTANAQIEIKIDIEGNYISAESIVKEDALTIIPVTEDSATRSSGISPHPLCDKLCYIAGDYDIFVKSGKGKSEYHQQYMILLKEWSQRTQVSTKIKAIYQYLNKGKVIEDLVESKVLQTDDYGHINDFKVGDIKQEDAFVRFIVINPLQRQYTGEVWRERELFKEYENFYMEIKEKQKENMSICYVTGKILPISEKHPAKIRHTGDKSKIISANDTSGYTYRGRFSEASQAVSVSFAASQKAHNALRWLIKKQGYLNSSEVIVSWCIEGKDIPNPMIDTFDFLNGLPDEESEDAGVDTGSSYAVRLNKAIGGYKANLGTNSKIVVMAVDTADGSGQGRLSITFYSELEGTVFLDNIQRWHQECSWRHTYKKIDDKYVTFIGAPSPKEIAYSAYGSDQEGLLKADEKVVKNCVKRLLPCIIHGNDLPWDIMQSMVRNVSRPMSLSQYNFSRMLSNTCAVIIRYKKNKYIVNQNKENAYKEEWGMSLNTKTQNRSYLFGRLLAVADKAESRTYEKEDGGRWTNAKRYWSVYSKQPAKTWKTIEDNLVPYLMKLKPGESKKYQQLIIDIGAQFNDNEFSNQPLTENYLLGYYCQMSELKFKDSSVTNANAGNPSINNENISAEGDNEDE